MKRDVGYLRTTDGKTLSIANLAGDDYRLSVQWKGYQVPPTYYHLSVSPLGTFNVTLKIPKDIQHGMDMMIH